MADQMGVQATSVISGAFLSGAMMGLSLVTVPVFLDTNTQSEQLLTQFVSLYNYGHKLMPAISVATFALHGFVASKKRAASKPWLIHVVAAVTTIAMVPFTWICMAPTNNILFRLHASSGTALDEVQSLITQWQLLHVARSLFPLAGAIIGWKALFKDLMC